MRHPDRIDWAAALAFWLGLDPPQRTYAAVAAQFGVSSTSVRNRAKRDDWPARSAELDRKAQAKAEQQALRSRSERITRSLLAVDRYRDAVRDAAAAGELKPDAAGLASLIKVESLLEGEAEEATALVREHILLAGRELRAFLVAAAPSERLYASPPEH